MGLRADVYELDGGRCVGCGKRLARGGTLWDWVPHHCILEQVLKARRLRPKWWRGPALCILLCFDCHGLQHNRKAPVPLERLPERVRYAAALLGPWAEDLLARYHPREAECRTGK